jgi:CRP-like cAMP-binding protein
MTTTTTAVDPEMIARLARHPFLSGMEPHHIEVLSESAQPVAFEAGQVIFRAGGPATGFYLIESGAVAVETSKDRETPITIDTVHAGEPLGWSWLFEPCVWEFGARALEPTPALFFSRERMWQHHEEDLTLGHDLFKRISTVMVRRLNAARWKLLATQPSNNPTGAKA